MKAILTILGVLFAASTGVAISERTPAPRPQVEVGTIARMVVKQVLPVYPQEMLRQGIEGKVSLEVVVDGTGTVVDVITLRSTNGEFASAACRAVWQWEFVPADPPNPNSRQTFHLPVHFRLVSR